jgi:hypothetical protein
LRALPSLFETLITASIFALSVTPIYYECWFETKAQKQDLIARAAKPVEALIVASIFALTVTPTNDDAVP